MFRHFCTFRGFKALQSGFRFADVRDEYRTARYTRETHYAGGKETP
jgi:hypothetical protein